MKMRRLPMTPLRQRMLEDMQLRNYSPLTLHCSLRCVADCARHFGASPAHLGPEQVRTSPLFLLQDTQLSWTSVLQPVCALRFFYRIPLGRPEILAYIASPQRPLPLPIILSPAAVATLLTTPRHLKHRASLTTLSAAGLRVSELCQVQVTDIDSARMVLRGRHGKGQHERYVMLSPKLLPLLRHYWQQEKPRPWLFPGHPRTRPITTRIPHLRPTNPPVRRCSDQPDDDTRDGRCEHRRSVRTGQELGHSKTRCPPHTAHSNEDRGAHCSLPSFPPGRRDGRRNITTS